MISIYDNEARQKTASPHYHKFFGGGGWIRTIEAEATDLQSAPFDHSGTPPYGSQSCVSYVNRLPHLRRRAMPVWSWQTDLNPRPADYKSAALPTELRQHSRRLTRIYYKREGRVCQAFFEKILQNFFFPPNPLRHTGRVRYNAEKRGGETPCGSKRFGRFSSARRAIRPLRSVMSRARQPKRCMCHCGRSILRCLHSGRGSIPSARRILSCSVSLSMRAVCPIRCCPFCVRGFAEGRPSRCRSSRLATAASTMH